MSLQSRSPALLPALAALLLAGCSPSSGQVRIEPTVIQVQLSGDPGTADAPLPFSSAPATWQIEVQTLDKNGDPYAFTGDLSLRVRPGSLDQGQWITVADGHWQGDVSFHSAFGPTRIWVSDEGDKNADSGRAASYATGVADEIVYALPTISEMQTIADHETNQLAGEFAELRIADRQVVVSEVGTAGFWVTDLADPPGSYNNLFVYSFSKPDGLAAGDRLSVLNGGTQEYLATTQINFPYYETVAGETLPVPDPIEIPPTSACSNDLMEALESSRVVARDLTIPADFTEGSIDYDDYLAYGQWPVDFQAGGCRIYVDNTGADDGFYPPDHAGEALSEVQGVLTEVWGKWIVGVAGGQGGVGGLETNELRPGGPHATGLGFPIARPRPGASSPLSSPLSAPLSAPLQPRTGAVAP